MVPWDDDIDILLNVSDKQRFRDSVLGSKEFTLLEFKENLWKYFKTNRSELLENNRNYMWPFIDILFYYDDGQTLSLLWDTVDPLPTFNKNDVFPLSFMPFDIFVVPVPKKPEIVLKIVHGDISLCVSNIWSHQHEEPLKNTEKVPCSTLYSIYPFVHRADNNGTIREELRIKNETYMVIERIV
ncbi:hypothetical protein DPMN_115249 [Dreissena polymorpha]|uniref:Uncharacterized protein n=2 Tax=Dreissena polymorpha TaxID=45954 RepID=A0A9D4QTK4_DREPO|nr:hypothetical protein DPMN_115249 [Dreissena polymorpha]